MKSKWTLSLFKRGVLIRTIETPQLTPTIENIVSDTVAETVSDYYVIASVDEQRMVATANYVYTRRRSTYYDIAG